MIEKSDIKFFREPGKYETIKNIWDQTASTKRLVAFTGPMGCGKTTAAAFLSAIDWFHLSFASPLKQAAMDIFRLSEEQVFTLEGKQTVDPRWGMSPREILQKLGTEAMRGTFPDVWVKHMEFSILEIGKAFNMVIDDLRFPDEGDLIRRLGGIIVHIKGRDAYGTATDSSRLHSSEQGLPVEKEDLVFWNNGSLEELRNQVISII